VVLQQGIRLGTIVSRACCTTQVAASKSDQYTPGISIVLRATQIFSYSCLPWQKTQFE